MLPTNDKQYHMFDFALLLLTVAVVYGRFVGHDFLFNQDDNLYVIDNETICGFKNSVQPQQEQVQIDTCSRPISCLEAGRTE